jgi:hydrogenase maturation protease
MTARPRVLVAGLGNIFLGDDGFGVEVVKRLSSRSLPEHVAVADFGIRGLHLAYELLEARYETTILVDATSRGEPPGTLSVLEPAPPGGPSPPRAAVADGHGMSPDRVLDWLRSLGGEPGRVLVVGCEPLLLEEEIGLSAPVERAVGEAVNLVLDLVARERVAAERSCKTEG